MVPPGWGLFLLQIQKNYDKINIDVAGCRIGASQPDKCTVSVGTKNTPKPKSGLEGGEYIE